MRSNGSWYFLINHFKSFFIRINYGRWSLQSNVPDLIKPPKIYSLSFLSHLRNHIPHLPKSVAPPFSPLSSTSLCQNPGGNLVFATFLSSAPSDLSSKTLAPNGARSDFVTLASQISFSLHLSHCPLLNPPNTNWRYFNILRVIMTLRIRFSVTNPLIQLHVICTWVWIDSWDSRDFKSEGVFIRWTKIETNGQAFDPEVLASTTLSLFMNASKR